MKRLVGLVLVFNILINLITALLGYTQTTHGMNENILMNVEMQGIAPTEPPMYTLAPTEPPMYTLTPTEPPMYTLAPTVPPVYTPEPTEDIFSSENEFEFVDGVITKYVGESREVFIPSQINGENVIEIGEYAFAYCYNIISVKISSGVKSIEDGAFSNCSNLTEIEMPSGVTHIGENAFVSCENLADINIPNSVTSIGRFAFYCCNSLICVNIPSSITYIGYGAFYDCDKLREINVEEGNINYSSDESGVLYNKKKSNLIQYPKGNKREIFYVPDSVINIDIYAFGFCTNLVVVHMGKNLKTIGNYAFQFCENLIAIYMHEGVTMIDGRAFWECSSLRDVYYSGTKDQWDQMYIAGYNTWITNATLHLNYNLEEEDKPLPNITRLIDAKFIGGQDIIYNVENNSYGVSQFELIGTLENLFQWDDWQREDYSAHNVEIELVLPDGYSFNKDTEVKKYTYQFDEIVSSKSTSNTIYINNPPVGISKINIKITGDNVEEKNITYDLNVDKKEFQIDIYRADYLINSKIGSVMENTYIDINTTPCKKLYDAGQENGVDDAVAAWDAVMGILNAVDRPSSMVDDVFEEKDIYSAIIMNMFESSVDYKFMQYIDNEVTKQAKGLISTVTSSMKNLYNYNVIDAEAVRNMTEKQKEIFESELAEAYREVHGIAATTADVTKIISNGIEYGKDIQEICQTIESYKSIRDLSESMKFIMHKMYEKCPSNNPALKVALLDCITVMNSGQTAFQMEMAMYSAGVIGKDVAQAGMDMLWGKIKTSFSVAHPAAFLFQTSYAVGKYATQILCNADGIAEKYCNIVAMVSIEQVMASVYDEMKNNFRVDSTQFNATTYNNAVDVMYNMIDTDCNYAIKYMDAIDSSLSGKLSLALGNTSTEEWRKSIKTIQRYTSDSHVNVLTDWILNLETDYPNKFHEYEHYYYDIREEHYKIYNINCPVDVYVYDKNGVIVGSVVNNVPYCRDDANITISVIDGRKTIYMYGDEYDIVYKGNDIGTMDITITEYDETNSATRNTWFNNLELTEGLTYTSSEMGTNSTDNMYTLLNEADKSIVPDFDSLIDANEETYTAQISRGYFNEIMAVSQEVHSGENVDITAYVSDGYKFVKWTSDAECDIFDDATSIKTKITMPEYCVNITANLIECPSMSISSITDDSVSVEISGCDDFEEGIAIIAIYDRFGTLEKFITKDIDREVTFEDVHLKNGTAKVMLWKNRTNLVPLCDTLIIEL